MSKRYRVTFDREKCIGALACTIPQPDTWVHNKSDDKVDLKGSKKKGDLFVLEFSEEELEKFQEAAEVCPVQVISIEEIK